MILREILVQVRYLVKCQCFQASRRNSVDFTHADPHKFSHVVDEDSHIKDKLKRIDSVDGDESCKFELSGEPSLDAAIVCRWVAASYGETSRAYHEAYSREIFRQMRLMNTTYSYEPDSAMSSAKKRSWF